MDGRPPSHGVTGHVGAELAVHVDERVCASSRRREVTQSHSPVPMEQ